MNQRIIPALLPESADELRKDVQSLRLAHEVQVDLVDGDFVPFSAWPYDPLGDPDEVTDILSGHSVEVDLMVRDQVAAAERWAKWGAQLIIFHSAGITYDAVEQFAERYTSVSIGLALTNDESLDILNQYYPILDQIQLMGIATIGAQGTPFDERVLDRIKAVRNQFPELQISIDGSMNQQTIPLARDAGADRFVVGSALLRADDRVATYQSLSSLAEVGMNS